MFIPLKTAQAIFGNGKKILVGATIAMNAPVVVVPAMSILVIDQARLANLIRRLERMRGPYMGDGINPGFTTHEVLEFLRLLQSAVDRQEVPTHNSDIVAGVGN